MASRTPRSDAALRPSVLDRLLAPARADGGGPLESIGVRELCAAVSRDLEWLLNSKRWLPQPADALPLASGSILAYGLPDLARFSWRSPGDAEAIAETLADAICRFEPRLQPHTVRVSALPSEDLADFRLRFRIDAVLHAEPLQLPVSFDTDVDFEASRVEVRSPL